MNHPIFVVGFPRSGTTLLSTILSRHSKLHCGVETQFFRRLKRRAENDFAHAGHWPDDGVDFIESLTINRQNVRGAYGVTKVDLRRLLAKHPPSTGHLLDIWLTEAARLQGKVRWIEKTPGHLLDVQTIRSIYPQAKIIRIMRDPRDCALSMSRMPWFHTHPLANLEMCAIWDWSANEFFQADPASRVVYYEELVSNPEESVSALCEFIDESYEQSMLESSPSKSTLIASGEWWKSNSLAEIDTTRTFQWKKTFRLDLLPAAELISHEVIVRHDYEQSNEPRQTFVCNEFDDPFASEFESTIVDAAKKSIRFQSLELATLCQRSETFEPSSVLYCTIPRLGPNRFRRLRKIVELGRSIIAKRLRGVNCLTISNIPGGNNGWAERSCSFLFQRLCKRVDLTDWLSKQLTSI